MGYITRRGSRDWVIVLLAEIEDMGYDSVLCEKKNVFGHLDDQIYISPIVGLHGSWLLAQQTFGISSVERDKGVSCYVNEMTFLLHLRSGSCLPGESTLGLEAWNFQSHPQPLWWGKPGDWISCQRLVIKSIVAMWWSPHKTQRGGNSESFWVGEHVGVQKSAPQERTWKLPALCSYLALPISSVWLFLNYILLE